jgi:glycerol uptake facilitator-like aquaporin
MNFSMAQKLTAEFIGTMLLLAIVIGSGIMGDALSTDDGIALLGNTIATGAGLVILILIFGPVSGAHFNPAVTLSFVLQKQLTPQGGALYVLVQVLGGIAGVWLAHLMFDLDILQVSYKGREGLGQMTGEAVATFGLIMTILGCVRFNMAAVPYAVGLFITAGYWFTSSTSFANPAVTIARMFSDTFAGITPTSAPAFVIAQLIAAVGATFLAMWLFKPVQKS